MESSKGKSQGKGNSKMFASKKAHDEDKEMKDADSCTAEDGSQVPLGSTKCVNHDSYTCGKHGWYKDGGKC